MNSINQPQTGMQLYDAEGRRLYFTEDERRAFVTAAAKAPREVRTFCGVLHATGCRISDQINDCAVGAKNHGAFVSCVAHLTDGLKSNGTITDSQKGAIQSCAAHASH